MALFNRGHIATRDGSISSSGDLYTSFDINGGAIKMAGTSDNFRCVHPSAGDNENPVIVARQDVGVAQTGAKVNVSVVTSGGNGNNNLVILRTATGSPHGLSAGTYLHLYDTTGLYSGPVRVISIESTTGFVASRPYAGTAGTVTYSPIVGSLANMTVNNYSMMKVVGTVHGQTTTALQAGASDYGRRSVHAITAIRTRKVATAIRAGYWNPFTGQFTTDPTLANDYADFDTDGTNVPDDEVKNIVSNYGVGGEFAYRNGTRSVITEEYDIKTT